MYREIQQAIEAAVAAIVSLPKEEWGNWLSYFLEIVEDEMGESELFEVRDILLTRIELGGW